MQLNSHQRKYLRGLAHAKEPVVIVGQDGLHDSLFSAIDQALTDHELIKIKLTDDRDERGEMCPLIEEKTASNCVGQIGRIGIFYRPHKIEEKRKIILPIKQKDTIYRS